jgi:hypothetical protein
MAPPKPAAAGAASAAAAGGGGSKTSGKGIGGDKLQQKSPAEFFAENKNIAGFDNVGACRVVVVAGAACAGGGWLQAHAAPARSS